jgi:hypothetical protein
MKKAKIIFEWMLIGLGILLLCLALFILALWFLRPQLFNFLFLNDIRVDDNSEIGSVDRERVSLSDLRTNRSLTGEQEVCLVDLFGQARVNEIKSGNRPTRKELQEARSCL